MTDVIQKIQNNPKFKELVRSRNAWGIWLGISVLLVYYGYILLLAFDKELLARKVGAGWTMSIGIPMGIGVIAFTIVVTLIYVRKANSDFDRINAEIIKETRS